LAPRRRRAGPGARPARPPGRPGRHRPPRRAGGVTSPAHPFFRSLSLAMLRGGVLSRRPRGETTMMPLSGSTGPLAEELYPPRASWGWFLLAGIVLILLGFLAISSAFIAGLLSVLPLGFLLMVCGVAEAVGSFGARRWGGFFLQLIAGVLYFFLGLMM